MKRLKLKRLKSQCLRRLRLYPATVFSSSQTTNATRRTNNFQGLAADASALYARNLFAFAGLFLDKEGKFAPDYEDEILKAALVTQGGAVVHPNLTA